MKNYAWSIGIGLFVARVILLVINSNNSSARHREVITYDPTIPLREEYTYVGGCYCPYDLDPRGYRCGDMSAWSRLEGDRPMCYLGDKYAYPPNY